jgi:hypothetical protein
VRRLAATTLLFVAIGVALALALPPRSFGDAGEYLLMTESWFRHGSPALEPQDVDALRVLTAGRSPAVSIPDVLNSYFPARNGRRYASHFWAYPLAGIPARALVQVLGVDPLRALPLTNALLFGAAVAAVLVLPWPNERRLLLAGLLLFSPALGFLLWPHPEVMCFSLVVLALVAWERGAVGWAVLAAALASLQNPPLLLLVAFLGLHAALPGLRHRPRRVIATAVLAALPALLPAVFFRSQFGVYNLSVRPGEAMDSLSFPRSLDLLFDLNLGMLPYLPVTVALGLSLVVRDLLARRPSRAIQLAALLLGMILACTANSNWNNGTTGPSRYVAWLFPIVAFALVRPGSTPPQWAGARAIGAALVVQAAILVARGAFLAPCDYLEHSTAARFVLDRWPRLYNPAPEVFAERTAHDERALNELVVYQSGGRCRKALARWRHGDALAAHCGPHPEGGAAFFATRPAGGQDAKRAWVYVDY